MPESTNENERLTVSVILNDFRLSERICRALNEEAGRPFHASPCGGRGSDPAPSPDCLFLLREQGASDRMLQDRMAEHPGKPVIIALPSHSVARHYVRMRELGADYVLPFDSGESLIHSLAGVLHLVRKERRIARRTAKEYRTKLPFAVTIMDAEGKIQFWNDVAEQLFGRRAADVIGRKADENIASGLNFINRLLEKGENSGQGDLHIQREDGSELICQWRACPSADDNGITVVFNDITNRVQVEQELREAIRAADAAFRAKSEFLAVMSHEIRTPMNSIIGFTELLLDTPVDKRQRDYMEIVRSNGISLLELINNVLEFSRIESGKLEITLAPVDLTELVAGVIDSMWVEASRKGIELYSRIHDEVPQKVMAVEMELRRILLNLVSNGVKFTEHGAVQVFVQTMFVEEKPFLLFQVNDTGIGIDPDKSDRLFQSFSQIDSSSTRRYGGTGLGLAISKKLCESMGGRMWVQSTPGKGSTFFFTLPLVSVDKSRTPRRDGRTDAANMPDIPEDRPSLKILVAEDEPMNQLLVKRFLSKLGQSCELASNGREAVEKLGKDNYDLVLMDVQMPEMDGIHAAREVREGHCGEDRKGVYICALTAYAMAGDQERCIDAGMNDYLSKPLTLPALRRAINRAAGQVSGCRN